MIFRNAFHKSLCSQSNKLTDWYCNYLQQLKVPIYSSYDIRDAGFKISNVDANIYPAGFNNICPTDKDSAVAIMDQFIKRKYGSSVEKVLLLTEEHTTNPYYWDNVFTISQILESSGKKVIVGIPKAFENPVKVNSASGREILVHSGFLNNRWVQDFKPDLVISNNDFSDAHEDWAATVSVPIDPPRQQGWYQRKKSGYFANYNKLVTEFANLVELDPFQLNVRTELFENFDLESEQSVKSLAGQVDAMLSQLGEEYKKRGIDQQPFVFVKNNAGTYGLAVVRVGSGSEIFDWNSKSRKKMKAAKGGRSVEEVIIQEGIPSRVQSDGVSAEPVIYMIGSDLAGGFLRTHAEKGSTDSLNSPGAVFKKLCVSDLNVSLQGSPLENVYGWTARLGLLAIGLEAQQIGIK
jgi:glutamate--cysteine ligase